MTLETNDRPATVAGTGGAAADADVERAFRHLLNWWKRDTLVMSSTTQMFRHPAYRAIVAMGDAAVPLLLDELRREPDQWIWALRDITGVDILPPPDCYELPKLTDAWL